MTDEKRDPGSHRRNNTQDPQGRVSHDVRNESGVTALEYALMAALIFLAIIVGVNQLSTTTSATYDKVANSIKSAMSN